MNIDEKIKELEEKLEDMSTQLRILKEKKTIDNLRERPSISDNSAEYYYVSENGEIFSTIDAYTIADNYCYSTGNYFKTYKKAKRYQENLITYQQLKDIALRLNNGQEIEWNNQNQNKYYIYFNYFSKNFTTGSDYQTKNLTEIYCLDGNFLDVVLEEIGEERLKQLLEWGI